MKDIDEILLNIDRDDVSDLVQDTSDEERKKDELAGIIESLDETNGGDGAALVEEPVSIEPAAPESPQEPQQAVAPGDGSPYTIRGTKSWNRREPYIITIDPKTLSNDLENLKRSFYYIDEPTDHETVRIRVKQEIVTFMRRPDDHITERYAGFICAMVASVVEGLLGSFEIGPDEQQLFIYHAGPLTIYKIIRDRFTRFKLGQCYKYLPGNKAARFYPEEYIKFIVLRWFEENINSLDLPFDSIHDYEAIRGIVMKRYQNDLRTFNTRFDQIAERIGHERKFSRNALLAMKGGQWFGHDTIETYRRFLGTSIFL